MDDWLVSVVKDGKVKELYYSRDLADMIAIRALNPGCSFEKCHIGIEVPKQESQCTERPKEERRKWAKRVQCVETGETWPTIIECSKATGIAKWTLYKSVHDGSSALGLHFVVIKEE